MEDKRLVLKYPIVVEGKYDKIKLSSIISSPIITTDGFTIFNNAEKLALLKRLSAEGGIIILTDSDKAGFFIRSELKGLIGPQVKLINLYIPQIKGKEKRKSIPGKDGLIGVEGMPVNSLKRLLEDFASNSNAQSSGKQVTKQDFYGDGLSGGENSSEIRDKLAKKLDLPSGMSSNSLLEAINLISDYENYKKALDESDE
ncbi:MAG: DUF4093 domain-containing protein [Eubacteriales bacterium]|nr:DUF4093 domain-containing protein [Eubacteriales bacterium]MDD4475844.1 DUF4093 domain-containing protein [Eubacteriales bacterium]